MKQPKKQYHPISGQTRIEKILDWITMEKNFRWLILGFAGIAILVFSAVFVLVNILERPNTADHLLTSYTRLIPFLAAVVGFNPLSVLWELRKESSLKESIKGHLESRESCTYDELLLSCMPLKIHLGFDSALDALLDSYLVIPDTNKDDIPCYRLSTKEEWKRWFEENWEQLSEDEWIKKSPSDDP